jgi:hypothetical protein
MTEMTKFTGDHILDVCIIGMELQERLQEYFELNGDVPCIQVASALCHLVADFCGGDDILASDVLLHVTGNVLKMEVDQRH